mmetsp:Transcript_9973/g.24657  ORF Transcript_9973/g.24657 Transcript_9973/m.24657 type:complete len:81 (-) Transcript_9973:30-272(-)
MQRDEHRPRSRIAAAKGERSLLSDLSAKPNCDCPALSPTVTALQRAPTELLAAAAKRASIFEKRSSNNYTDDDDHDEKSI